MNAQFDCPEIVQDPAQARWSAMAKHLLETLRVFSDADHPSQCRDMSWVKDTLLNAEPCAETSEISEFTLDVWRMIMNEYPRMFDTVYFTMIVELIEDEPKTTECVAPDARSVNLFDYLKSARG